MEEWLQEAFGESSGCPSIERLAEAVAGHLSAEERATIERHASDCPACSAELELARPFVAGSREVAQNQEDLAYVVGRLIADRERPESPGDHKSSRPKILSFPTRQTAPVRRWTRIAAAIVLVVGAGTLFQVLRTEPPTLPEAVPTETTRGSSIEIVEPQGEIPAPPARFSWQAHPGAATYRVRLLAVDGSVLVDEMIVSPTLALAIPQAVQDRLHPGAVYHWQVEALDDGGALVGWSEKVSFRIGRS